MYQWWDKNYASLKSVLPLATYMLPLLRIGSRARWEGKLDQLSMMWRGLLRFHADESQSCLCGQPLDWMNYWSLMALTTWKLCHSQNAPFLLGTWRMVSHTMSAPTCIPSEIQTQTLACPGDCSVCRHLVN